MGHEGAALATVAAQAVSSAWVLGYFLSGKSLLRLRAANLRLQWPVCGPLLAIGSAPFALQIANSFVHILVNNQLGKYSAELGVHGDELALAVWGIIYGVFMLIFMPVFGINQGAQPIIGYNYGAERFDRVKKTLQAAVLAASGIAVGGFAVTMLLPAQVLWLFSRDQKSLADLAGLGVHAMRLCTLMLPLVGFQIVSSGYFQAVGKPAQAMFLTLSRQVLLLIPAVLILPRFFHLDGVWMSLPVADLGSSVLTGLWLLRELRHLQRRHVATAAPRLTDRGRGG